MLNKPVRAAVIGLGIGEQHLSALLMHPHATLSGVCDLDNMKASSIFDKYQLPRVLLKNFSEILNDPTINLVTIASFDDNHFDQVVACLNKGKHVFVEKPLCQTSAQLKEIFTIWKKSGLGLSSNLLLRKAPLYVWLENEIASGSLGEIYAIDLDYLYGRIHKITQGWRSSVDNYSVMAGGGIHMIDLMTRFMRQKPRSVQSCANKIATQKTSFRYPDFHAATFYFDNGGIGRVTANFGCMHRHQHVVRIFGTKATFIYDDAGARVHRNRDENSIAESLSFSPKPAHKGALLLDFVNDIMSGNYTKKSITEFDLMSIVNTVDRSINSGCALENIEYLGV